MKRIQETIVHNRKQPGVVLLVTLVLLVILSILGYTLTNKVLTQSHRNQYLMDYTNARYGCDSGIKYALAIMEDIDPELTDRSEQPDFSDLFGLSNSEYKELVLNWEPKAAEEGFNINSYEIPGPYGALWPYITDPIELEIDQVKIKIEIEDENAKYPLGWAILDNKELQREIDAGFVTFFELMGLEDRQISSLRQELSQIAEIRPFEVVFQPKVQTVRTPVATTSKTPSGTVPAVTINRTTITAESQIADQTQNFVKLFHSSILDTEILAKPIENSYNDNESVLKYVGIWGTRQVNVNTAPRYVLEAAFTFGGREVEIADAIIQKRRQENFENVADIKEFLTQYSDSVEKCEQFITTNSEYFTIRVTATCGNAQASSVIGIRKDDQDIERIAVINS